MQFILCYPEYGNYLRNRSRRSVKLNSFINAFGITHARSRSVLCMLDVFVVLPSLIFIIAFDAAPVQRSTRRRRKGPQRRVRSLRNVYASCPPRAGKAFLHDANESKA
jgi:hypothetical protein